VREFLFRYLVCGLLVFGLLGCETLESGNKEDLGTALGAAIGAVIAAAAEDDDKVRAAVIGGVLGALIGNRIGHYLDEKDRKELADVTTKVLDENRVGESTIWNSSQSSASAELTLLAEETKEMQFKTGMQAAAGIAYTSTHLNFRAGPGTAFRSKQVLSPNTRLELRGITENGWYKVSTSSGEEGYVFAKYLSESRVAIMNTREESRAGKAATNYEIRAKLDVKCKTVLVRTRVDGQVFEDTAETCQDENGSWGA